MISLSASDDAHTQSRSMPRREKKWSLCAGSLRQIVDCVGKVRQSRVAEGLRLSVRLSKSYLTTLAPPLVTCISTVHPEFT